MASHIQVFFETDILALYEHFNIYARSLGADK